MNTQPEALRLADALEAYDICASVEAMPDLDVVAAELRRLHSLNAELLKALNLVQVDCQYLHHEKKERHLLSQPCPVSERIHATIAKATGESK
jgi:hypothetical protein